jgi:APA family basic amino acid/polyamine antiporter
MKGFQAVLRRSDVFLLGVAATFNLNLVAMMAATGWVMPLLMAAVLLAFVIPQAVAVVELNRQFPGEGGMAEWVRHHFGPFAGFLTAWCYWAINVVYVPAIILFLVENLDAFIHGAPSTEGVPSRWLLPACLATLWLVLGLSVLGFRVSRWFSNAGGCGTLLALIVLVALCGSSAVARGGPSHPASATPSAGISGDWTSWASFGVFCMALVGPELGSVIGEEVRESSRVVPWSVWRVSIVAVVCYLLGAGALQLAVPAATIHSVRGVLAVASAVAESMGVNWAVWLLALFLGVSAFGAALTWFAGASRMLWVAGHDGALAARFANISPRLGTPVFALLFQASLSTLVLTIGFAGAGAQQVFTTLVDLSVVLQLFPYLTTFAALVRAGITSRGAHARRMIAAGTAGVASSLASIVLAFVPLRQVESIWVHEAKLAAGCILFFGSCGWIFAKASISRKRSP